MRFLRNPVVLILLVTMVVGGVLTAFGLRMTKADLHISAAAEPLFCIGGVMEAEHCASGVPFTNSLLMTIIVDLVLIGIGVWFTTSSKLVPRGFQNAIEAIIEFFYNFALGIDRKNIGKFFPVPATIFLFFLVGNILALFPFVGSVGGCYAIGEEHAGRPAVASVLPGVLAQEGQPNPDEINPTFANWPGACYHGQGYALIPFLRAPAADLNITFAWALVTCFLIEFFGFQALGLGYLNKFFINPFKGGPIQTFVGLLELLGEFTRLIAFAFRIFGNIFGGEVVLVVMSFLFSYVLPLPFYGLELFVAFIQAVIFAVLALVFFSLAVQAHGHDDEGHAEPVESASAH